MLPLTPGMTMVAAAMIPTTNSFTISMKLRSIVDATPLASPITAINTTIAKNMIKGIILEAFVGFDPFTFFSMKGRLPAIKPQKAKFVGIGCTSNRYSNNLERITIANPAPKKIGNKSFKLSFNSDLM